LVDSFFGANEDWAAKVHADAPQNTNVLEAVNRLVVAKERVSQRHHNLRALRRHFKLFASLRHSPPGAL